MQQAPSVPATPEELLAHARWLRALARSLVGDPSFADDLTQETWKTAFRRPPGNDRPLRPWLAQVLRNSARMAFRRRRIGDRALEQVTADEPGVAPSPEVLLERVETERMLTQLVVGLREPFRSTLLLRYFEGYNATEIARMQGVPPGTVRWRLKEALDDLRTQLADRHGSKRAWVALLLPLTHAGRSPVVARPGALATPAGGKLAVLAALLVVAAGATWWLRATHGGARERTGAAVSGRLDVDREDLVAWSLDPSATRAGVEGHVLDADGHAVAGALVVAARSAEEETNLHPPAALALSGEDGRYRLGDLVPGRYALTATVAGRVAAWLEDLVAAPGRTLRGVDLRLGREGVTLSGLLLDSGGGAIAGGTLSASPVHGAHVFQVSSGSDGQYQVTLPRGGYHIVARADGYAPDTTSAWLDGSQRRNFRLHAAARLTGRVVAGGEAVAGAEVRLLGTDSTTREIEAGPEAPEELRTTTDAAGLFTFSDLDPGAYQLFARKGGLVGQPDALVRVGFAAAVDGVEIVLQRGRSVSGRVRAGQRADSAGVARAVVLARTQDVLRFATPVISALARGDGTFTIEGLIPGVYHLEAQATGKTKVIRPLVIGAKDVQGVELVLDDGTGVTGRVLDRASRPVASATVSAWVLAGNVQRDHVRSTQTDAEGRFRIADLDSGELRVAVSHSLGSTLYGPVAVGRAETRRVDLVIDDATVVAGTVRNRDGTPAAGVEIRSRLMGLWWLGSAGPQRVTISRADGTYELRGHLPGDVLVQAGLPGQGSAPTFGAQPNFRRFSLAPGERREGVDLTVPPLDVSIRGVVVDEKGRPVEGAVVSGGAFYVALIWERFGKYVTGADGAFEIAGLTQDEYVVRATHPDYPPVEVTKVRPGASDVRLAFVREAALSGQVVTRDGRAATDYTITAVPGPSSGENPEQRSVRMSGAGSRRLDVHDPEGRFAFDRLGPGAYELSATAPDATSAVYRDVALASGQRVDHVRIVLAPSATVKGRVVEYGSKRPIPHALVQGRGASGLGLEATAGEDGRFELPGVPAGRDVEMRVTGQWQSHVRDDQEVSIPAQGGEIDIGEVKLQAGKLDWFSPGAGLGGLIPVTRNGRVVVQNLRTGAPAALAGVRVGDLVLAVDGHDTRDAGASTVNALMRGEAGALLTLTLQTPGQPARTVELVRVPMTGR